MNFKKELERGNFLMSECTNCKKVIWPVSEFCDRCLKPTKLRNGNKKGKILEFSKKGTKYFCLGEFEGKIRIIGIISEGIPNENDEIEIKRCGIKDDSYFFEFDLLT